MDEMEEATLRRLSGLSDSTPIDRKNNSIPELEEQFSADVIVKSSKHSKKRKRKQSHLKTKEGQDTMNLSQMVSEATILAEKRILEQTLIRPRNTEPSTASRALAPSYSEYPDHKSSGPVIVKAGDVGVRHPPGKKDRKSRSISGSGKGDKDDSNAQELDAAEFVDSHRREIGRFGSQALHKYDRKSFEKAERIRLGCRQPKNQKVPIGLLITKRRKQNIKAAKKKEMDLATGMLVRSKRRK